MLHSKHLRRHAIWEAAKETQRRSLLFAKSKVWLIKKFSKAVNQGTVKNFAPTGSQPKRRKRFAPPMLPESIVGEMVIPASRKHSTSIPKPTPKIERRRVPAG